MGKDYDVWDRSLLGVTLNAKGYGVQAGIHLYGPGRTGGTPPPPDSAQPDRLP